MKNKELQTTVKETELKLKQAISLPEVSSILIQLVQQFENKVELHVHFNIQSIGNVTDSTVIGNINGDHNTTIAGDNNFVDNVITNSQIGRDNLTYSNIANTVSNGNINGALGFSEFQKQIEEKSKLIDKQIAENSKRIDKQIKEFEKRI